MSTLQGELNRLAGTTGLGAQGAANVWAGTSGLGLAGALNAKAGTTGRGIGYCLNFLAGTLANPLAPPGAAALCTNAVNITVGDGGSGGTLAALTLALAMSAPVIKATPIIRGSLATGSTSAVASIACPLPVTANAGDLILLRGISRGGTTFTTPAGYTVNSLFNGTNKDMVSYFKIAAGGETTVTFDPANTNAMEGIVTVIQAGTFNAVTPIDVTAASEATTANNAALTQATATGVNGLALSCIMEIKGDTTAIAFTETGWTSLQALFAHNGTNGFHAVLYSRPQDAPGATPATVITSSPLTSSTWMSQTVVVNAA